MGQNIASVTARTANPALSRLLEGKGPARRKASPPDFLESLEEIIQLMERVQNEQGLLNSSISGVKWQEFMTEMGEELRGRLTQYRKAGQKKDFCPASLTTFIDDRARIERAYIRDLVVLYKQAAMTHQALSG